MSAARLDIEISLHKGAKRRDCIQCPKPTRTMGKVKWEAWFRVNVRNRLGH